MNNNVIKYIIKKNIFSFIVLGILLLMISGISIATSTILMKIIDDILPDMKIDKLSVAIGIYIGLCMLQIIFSYVESYYNFVFTMKTEMQLRKIITDKILYKFGDFFLKNNYGDIHQLIVGDISQVCSFVIENIFSIMYIVFSFLSSAIYLMVLNWKLFLLILFLQPLSAIVQFMISPVITRKSREQRDIVGDYILAVQDVFLNPIELILSGLNEKLVMRMNEKMTGQYNVSKKLQIVNGIGVHLTDFFGIITTCAVIAYGGYSIIYGNMSVGVLIVFITYSQKLIGIFDSIWNFSIDLSEVKPIYERVNKYFSENIPRKEGKIRNNATPNLEFKEVAFSYDKKRFIFQNLTKRFEYGKKYGIVGRTGEGKSTITKLIYNLWDINKGKIVIGESDCSEIDRESINKILMYISANTVIINDTIYNNIILGNEDVKEEDVYEVLKKVCLYDEVKEMEKGIYTLIGDNGNVLSTGQKQRLAIARAIIGRKKITILDEPTSALDEVTQEKVVQTIYKEFMGRTLIIITHDKYILKYCDEILELKNGNFVRRK